MELNFTKICEEFKKGNLNKSYFFNILLPIIEEHEDESLRLKAIEHFDELQLNDEQLYPFFEQLVLSDASEQIRNAALKYISHNFLQKSTSLLKWVLDNENSIICQITVLETLQKEEKREVRNKLIRIIKNIKKAKFLNKEKHYENQKYHKALKVLLKPEKLRKFDQRDLSEIIINNLVIKKLISFLPNVFFELNPESALIEQLDLSDYLEYEVKGTPWGWKNNIDDISKIVEINHLNSLKVLDLSNNLLKNLDELTILKNLTYLNLMNNRICDLKDLEILNKLPSLKVLNIDGNPIAQNVNTHNFSKNLTIITTGKYLEIK